MRLKVLRNDSDDVAQTQPLKRTVTCALERGQLRDSEILQSDWTLLS